MRRFPLAVATKDLKVLWASPAPYVVGALFHVVLGFLFVNQLEVRRQAVLQPLFPIAGFLLTAMVPLLTMRSFAEEARTGTLDLLLAVPVTARALVLGKWLASWATTLVVMAPAVLFVALLEMFGSPDRGPEISGFFGLALLSGLLAALGVATSAATSSQPIAAMVSFFVALLLWFAHVGSDALTTGALLARFSLSERLRGFAGGLVDTTDVAWFVLFAVACVVIAIALVERRRAR